MPNPYPKPKTHKPSLPKTKRDDKTQSTSLAEWKQLADMNARQACPKCHGYGFVHATHEKHDKKEMYVRCKRCDDCRVCEGSGIVIGKLSCPRCHARGFVHRKRKTASPSPSIPDAHAIGPGSSTASPRMDMRQEHYGSPDIRCTLCVECPQCAGTCVLDIARMREEEDRKRRELADRRAKEVREREIKERQMRERVMMQQQQQMWQMQMMGMMGAGVGGGVHGMPAPPPHLPPPLSIPGMPMQMPGMPLPMPGMPMQMPGMPPILPFGMPVPGGMVGLPHAPPAFPPVPPKDMIPGRTSPSPIQSPRTSSTSDESLSPRTTCPRCKGVGTTHTTDTKCTKPPKCRYCVVCRGCGGKCTVIGSEHCSDCATRGFVHPETAPSHDAPDGLRCFFCLDCKTCGGVGVKK
ncbi:hypothetical protein HDU85_006505 [Gaertneriomyces sp. JEL0708]|nr:hypothetical protein HDU85_006505 [Gaertneriomyces sp. JEL0708]